MSDYEVKPGRGTAFKNKRKSDEKHPDFNGEVRLPDGRLHFLDVWVQKTKAGDNYFSIKIGNEKTGAKSDRPVMDNTRAGGFSRDLDDSVPFAPEFR